ncbi:orotidine-5'-phosphate decarboxylase [Patescibacteria group bacterium]|nr:orotidine-5'-phosphate decarboxylase [Patescibacteria group bacterium]MBP9709938.1 orotidine-5'-phosphate decarboxylase [Patescibacteria group bacterium]
MNDATNHTTSPSTPNTFTDALVERICRIGSVLCVGIEPEIKDLPAYVLHMFPNEGPGDWEHPGGTLGMYGENIIRAVEPFAAAIKINLGFYFQYGAHGVRAVQGMIFEAQKLGLPVILDVKVGDGGNSAAAYARTYIGEVPVWDGEQQRFANRPGPLRGDAVTIESTIGDAGVNEYANMMRAYGTGGFVVVRTSFGKTPSRLEEYPRPHSHLIDPAWEELCHMVEQLGAGTEGRHGWRNLGAVVGATRGSNDARRARELLPDSFLLIPGFGAQGGDASAAVAAAREDGLGVIVNSSRGITNAWRATNSPLYAEAAATAAQSAKDVLNDALRQTNKGRGIFWDK